MKAKAKPQTRTVRQNRYKKNTRRQKGRWGARILLGLKLAALIVILSATSALFVMGYAAVTRSEYFQTRAISINGNRRLSDGAVMTQAGIQEGDNMFALNLGLVRRRLLAEPWIREARVTREIPATITIQIEEQVPLTRIDLGGRKFLLNTQGRVFKEIRGKEAEHLPMVTGVAYGDIAVGEESLNPILATVVQVLVMSQKEWSAIPYEEIAQLHMDKEMGIDITLKNEQVIKLGFGDYLSKQKRMRQLRVYLEGNSRWRDCKVVDLNDPQRVVVQLGGATD